MKKHILIITFSIMFMCLLCMFFINIICKNIKVQNSIYFDPYFDKQWYLQKVAKDVIIQDKIQNQLDDNFNTQSITFNSCIDLGINDFWHNTKKNKDKELIIALIDSYVDINHEDLKKHIWINEKEIPNNNIDDDNNGFVDDYYGWNFSNNSNKISSKYSNAIHGTHCAGIIAADHNHVGIMGILGNTNVKLMILPIYNDKQLKSDDLVAAIKYADTMGADICNITGVFSEGEQEINRAIKESHMYFIVSAGNFQSQYFNGLNLNKYKKFPACCNYTNVITVGSIDEKENLSAFSNYGNMYVDITAPGEYIYSTLPANSYGYESGTSTSAPIVTGILGAYYYSYTNTIDESVSLLLSNAKKNPRLNSKVNQGRIAQYILHFEK